MLDNTQKSTNYPLVIYIRARGEILIYKSVTRALGNPTDIHFWWSERQKSLLVSAANKTTGLSIPASNRSKFRKNGMRFTNNKLLSAINSLAGWENRMQHRLHGEYIPELDMVAFKTGEAALEVTANV